MRIIISPAKKMKTDTDSPLDVGTPEFLKETEMLLEYLKDMRYEEAKDVWKCNDNIAKLNYERIQRMNLYANLTPAILFL
nr:peroxide stress protein YaaA [Sedimentibacter sp.]